MFPRSYKNQENVEKGLGLNLAKEHLTLIQQKYDKYFFKINTENYDWTHNLFSAKAKMSTKELSLPIRENFFEIRNDRTLRLKFSEVQFDMFGFQSKKNISKFPIQLLKFFSNFARLICANKASHLCY